MLLVKGNKTLEINKEDLKKIIRQFKKTIIDLGTGDGRFVYENASIKPDTLFIGIDPSQTQLKEYSKKALKKKLINVLFVVGSLEIMPEGLNNIADMVYIILPWGTLLKNVVIPNAKTVATLRNLLKPKGTLEIILGYTQENEPTETERLQLPEINKNLVFAQIIPTFETSAFMLEEYRDLNKESLSEFKTTWSKKLSFGKERPLIYIRLNKN
jgi:16S rRNA (adenine(1408)-N(1))-methyltransferase